jgi:CheY-like chemotaxis protein
MARILIVDTQTELRHQLVRLLEQAGHRATAVATISEAATLLKEHVSRPAGDKRCVDGRLGRQSRQTGRGLSREKF